MEIGLLKLPGLHRQPRLLNIHSRVTWTLPQGGGGEHIATFAEQESTSPQAEERYTWDYTHFVGQERTWREREKQFCAAHRVTGKGTESSSPDPQMTCSPISHTHAPKPLLHCAMQMQSGIIPADPTDSPNNLTSSKCFLQVGKSLTHHEVVTICYFLIPSFPFVWEFTAMKFLQKPSKLPAPISCWQLICFYSSFPWIPLFIVNCSEAPRHTACSTMKPGKLQLLQLLVVKWDCENK